MVSATNISSYQDKTTGGPPDSRAGGNISCSPGLVEGRVAHLQSVSLCAQVKRITVTALPYIAYFLIAAAAVGALVLTHQALLPILCVAGAFTLLPTASLVCRAISYFSTKHIQQTVVDAQTEHLKEAFNCNLLEGDRVVNGETLSKKLVFDELVDSGVDKEKAGDFSKKVIQLRDEVLSLTKNGANVRSLEKMYAKFQELAKDQTFAATYRKIKDENIACVNFLKILSMKFRTAPVGETMGEYAKGNMPKVEKYNPEELGNLVRSHQDGWGVKRNTLLQQLFWLMAYPDRYMNSVTSTVAPQLYDSMETNNAVSFMDLRCNDIPVSVVAQPTLARDPVFDLIGKDAADQIVVNLLDTCKSNELPWIKDLERIMEHSKSEHMVFGFASKKKSSLMDENTSGSLLDSYKKEVLSDGRSIELCQKNGTYVRDGLLTEEEIKKCFEQVKELLPRRAQLNKRQKLAVLALSDAMMVFKRIVKKTKEMKEGPHVGDADMKGLTVAIGCKQCQDRGPVFMEAVMLLLKAYELNGNRDLTKEEFYQIASVALRPEINDGRFQLSEKAEVLEELFKLLGSDIKKVSESVSKLSTDR